MQKTCLFYWRALQSGCVFRDHPVCQKAVSAFCPSFVAARVSSIFSFPHLLDALEMVSTSLGAASEGHSCHWPGAIEQRLLQAGIILKVQLPPSHLVFSHLTPKIGPSSSLTSLRRYPPASPQRSLMLANGTRYALQPRVQGHSIIMRSVRVPNTSMAECFAASGFHALQQSQSMSC